MAQTDLFMANRAFPGMRTFSRLTCFLTLLLIFILSSGTAVAGNDFEKAKRYFGKEKYAKSRKYLVKYLEASPGDIAAECMLAETYAGQRKYRSAVKRYKQILDKHPENTDVMAGLGAVYQRGEYYNDAAGVYETILEKEPGNVQALFLLGMNKALCMDLDEAYTIYRRLKPKDEKLAKSLLHQIQGY